MASTNDLDRLKKSAQGIQATNDTSSESFSRDRVIRAEEVKTGLSRLNGSWASEYRVEDATDTSSELTIRTGLGQVGVGDIDFIPYTENTNRIGVKGAPSLGSPISFEVLGATLKSPLVDWTWTLDHTGNTLTINHATKTILTEYGIGQASDSPEVISLEDLEADHGGLYVVVNYVSNSYEKWASTWTPPTYVTRDDIHRAQDQIFRVESMTSTEITLSSRTPLSDWFDSGGDVAGIMFLRKKASRMLEAPQSEGTTFFVMPPETSASLDFEPPLSNWKAGDFHTEATSGTASNYGLRNKTAVPTELTHSEGKLVGKLVGTPTNASEFKISIYPEGSSPPSQGAQAITSYGTSFLVGKCLRITSVSGGSELTTEQVNSFYGFYEIISIVGGGAPYTITLRRVSEQNLSTGKVTWDASYAFGVNVTFTLHNTVSDLLSSAVAQKVEIESARVKALISPSLTSNNEASTLSESSLGRGGSSSWSGAEPSNLLDLGFGVVVYPAKISADTNSLVADYENPLSPDLYDVDYEGATVYLKSAYSQDLSITSHATNPSGKTVLFISCVALSQEASFGMRLTTIDEGMEKGAYLLPKIPQIMTFDDLLDISTVDHSTFWDGTNSIFIPSLSVDQVPHTGRIEADILDTFSFPETTKTLGVIYRGVSTHNNGVKLDNVKADFDPSLYGIKIESTTTFRFSRHGRLSFKQSALAGRSARSESITFNDGGLSYNPDGSISLSISGLRTDESTLIYDSSTRKWTVDSSRYEVGLELKRGDLVASNVTELPADQMTVAPVVFLSTSNTDQDQVTNDSHMITLDASAFENLGDEVPDYTGFYLNVEGAAFLSKKVVSFTDGARIIVGLDSANTPSNPWQSKFLAYKNDTGSAQTDVELSTALNTALKNTYTDIYPTVRDYFYASSTGQIMISGRSPSVFPSYSYLSTANLPFIVEGLSQGNYNDPAKLPSHRYLLSLEEVGGGKWVTVAVPVAQTNFPHSFASMNGDYAKTLDNAKAICEALNEDLYFGHSARLLNRAGFYEGFHQEYDNGTGDVTLNPSLQAKISAYGNHTVYGERQVLWITNDDPRHSNNGSAVWTDVTIELICTGRGCGKIPFIEGGISGDNLKDEASKVGNQLINVIASLGRAEQATGSTLYDLLFDGQDHTDYNRIGLYWESETLPDTATAEVKSVDAQAEGNTTELGFDRNGFLPVGPWVGSSRKIHAQFYNIFPQPSLDLRLLDGIYDGNERDSGSPIRNRIAPEYYTNDGTGYFDLLPFLDATGGQKNVGESFDFLAQDHWLDNPHFGFSSEDDLNEEELGLYTWVSRDYVYPTSTDVQESTYLGLICTFSVNKRERSSFRDPLMSESHTGYEDMIVSVSSDYFSRDLYSPNVIELGDDIYLNADVSGTPRLAKAKVTWRSQSSVGKYEYQASLKAVNGQYGGFSGLSYYQPVFAHVSEQSFSASFTETTGSNLISASVVGGNSFFWTQGNLRSLLTTASVPTQLGYSEFSENRDAGAIDGGFGSFGTQSASLLSGGRLGLFNGLPQTHAGISFASVSGGLGTSGYRGGQDVGQYGDDELRVFETFLEHGVFSYVSLPLGTGGSFSSTIGHTTREKGKKSDYKSAVFGGNSGLRVSGDINLFIRNMRILGSDDNTAFVMHTDYAPPTNTDFLISNADVTLDVTSAFLPYNQTGTGPTTSGLQAQKSAQGFTNLSLKSQGGAHMPSGAGLFGPVTSPAITDVSVRRTATISLGLTLADLKGISKSLGREVSEPVGSTERQVSANFPNQYGTEADIGSALFHMAQFSSSEIPTMALPSLRDAYVALMRYKHTDGSDVNHDDNWGIYKIIDTPVLMPVDASDLESGQGTRNTLHGYGSDYTTHTRSSLNTIVANIMVRVESDEIRSIYPDQSAPNQGANALTPSELVIGSTYYENSVLSKPTAKLGHSWRVLKRSAGNYYHDVVVFDVVDQGGSPSGAPSDLHGLEVNPRALGRDSFPAEIVPLGYSDNHNADMPLSLELAPMDYFDSEETLRSNTLGLRLLGVHRNMDHRGKTSSLAFVTSYQTTYQGEILSREPLSFVDTLRNRIGDFIGDSPARLAVYSSERSDRLDESASSTTKQLFENGESGYVSLGYPERFGLGVVLDGGLGVVSGNAVRVHPQKGNFDSLGSLSIYSSPLMDSRLDLRDGNAVSLPSRFNRAEFYGDVVVAGHDSDLVIDDARTADGAFARKNEADLSASTTKSYQSRLLSFGERWSAFGAWNGGNNSQGYIALIQDSIPNSYGTGTLPSYFLSAPPPPLPSDTILPWSKTGIRVKTGGTVVYERAFRPQDATGADIVASMAKGAKSDRGLRGLEIPTYGECMLLPKGPSTLGGRVFERDNSFTEEITSIGYGSKTKIRTGISPTDLPLYEFYNGPSRFAYGGNFAVTLGNVMQEHGVFERETASSRYFPISHSPKTNAGGGTSDRVDEFDAGILSQAYHHSRSNESATWGGQSVLFENPSDTRTIYVYAYYNNSSANSDEGFAVFYLDYNKRKVFLEIDTATYNATATAPLIQKVDPVGNGRPFVKADPSATFNLPTSNTLPESGGIWNAGGSFDIPSYVDRFYVVTSAEVADAGTPDLSVLFFRLASMDSALYGFSLGFGTTYSPSTPYLDLYPNVQSALSQVDDNRYLNKIDYPVGLPDWGSGSNPYDFDFNLNESDLISEGFSAPQRSNILESSDDPMTSNMQVRLLDGMVLEDVTTGTFYTVGDVGRYRGWHSHLKPISQPGDVVKYAHNNPYFLKFDELDSNPNLSFTRAPIRKMTAGSAIGNNGNTSPEVFYDLSGHFDYEQDCLDRNDASSQKNGFGDVSDNGYVRRPLLGHKFRVVPNVEFVPVLGHRSVKGGLAVPFDKATSYTTYIEEADAVFYDRDYSFLESDIGRKIYVCGTYEYAYVGWYVIIDIQKDYLVNPYTGISSANLDLFDVAVVRKIKRSGEYIRDWKSGDGSALPMRPRNMVLEACLDASSNGKRIYLDDAEKDYDIHVADPFFPVSSELSESFVASYSGTTVSGRADQNLVGYEPTSPLWMGVNLWAEDGSNRFFGVVADHSVLDPVTSLINEGSTDLLVGFLNASNNFNGVRLGRSLKAYNQANSATYTGWGSYADAKWIKWKVKYAVPDYNARFPVLGSKGFVVCGITCEIDTSVLTELQRKNVVNRGCFLQVDLQFHPQIDSTTHISTDKTALSHDRESRGFFRLSGVNSNISVAWADKNSYYPNQYEGYSTNASLSAFNYDVYVLDPNDPSYVMTARTFDLADESLYTKSQSASGGIRWVFSAPLLEENVGSYVHLTKPRPYRFGQPTYTQNERLQNELPSTYTNPFAWASGWQRKKDLENNDPFDLGTDIFRVNRCPSTGDILLGGDCESYSVEDIICRTRGGFTQKGIEVSYAPLSVMGNWPDSETNELPDTGALNFPILYALQPVARERIVTIKPSSANSSVVMAHGQYGIAPMVVPASPLALETTGAINTRFTDPLNFVAHQGGYYFDSDPLDATIASTLDNIWGSDYVFGERIMMDVSRPWLLMGRENASQSYRYFGTVTTSGNTNPKTGNPFIHASNNGGQLAWNPHTEGGNTESKRSYDKYSDLSDSMVNAIYTWSPSGEWWQIQTPLYIGFKSAFIDETTPPPTLRIDLTDSFTQSSSVGSGINSPYLGRTPKGSRLTRMWVNFGLNGDFADLPGALFDTNSKEHYNSVASGRYDNLDSTVTRTERISQAEDPSDYEFYKRKATNSAMTFNLVVEIPGSIGNSEDTFFMDRSDNSTDDWSDLMDQEYSFSSIGGGNGSAFGGRAPTSSYNHSSNSTRYSIVNGVSALRGKPRFSGGTIIVPLYVNREAGDLMPNVMERFVTVGPVRFKRDGGAVSDWSVGDAYTGFGAKGNTVSSFQYPESLSATGTVNGHLRFTASENHIYSDFDVNSFSPIVWGGQNFYSSETTLTNWKGLGASITLPDLATFEDVRSASVLASPMPRSSRTSGGVLSSFSSGLFSDTGMFSPENTNYELALHHSASTGITIAHSSISLETFINEEDFQGGNFGTTDANSLRQSPKSSPHSFTIALTPVGDAFEAPSSAITMPKLSGGSLYADTLYTDISGRQFASLGRYGRSLEVSRGTDPKDRRFKVGNWLDKILDYYGIPSQSGSMLPVGARVYLEATVPWSSRPFGGLTSFSNNGAWISSVKCAFEVETADGTAWTLDVNTMGED